MNGRELLIQNLIDMLDNMLDIIEEQESVESEFTMVHEVANHLREEIVALQE